MINGGIINTVAAAAEDCTTNNSSFPTSNLAYYKLDGDATDSAGTNNGTSTNVTWGEGRFGPAGVFNGGASYVDLNSAVLPSAVFSVSLWINLNSLTTGWLFSQYTPSVNGRFVFNVTPQGGFQINVSSTNSLATTNNNTVITTGKWHHVVVVKDSFNGWKLYADGQYHSAWNSALNIITNQNTILGGDNSVTGSNMNGSMDQVRIFNTAITPNQVTELYEDEIECCTTDEVNYPVTNTAYYQLNGGTGTTVVNEKGNNGTSTNVTYGAGVFNDAAVFNGGSSYINAGVVAAVNTTVFSVSCWVNFSTTATTGVFATNYHRAPVTLADSGWWLRYSTGNKLEFGGMISGTLQTVNNSFVPSLNTWYHIVAVKSATTMTLYIDGSQNATANYGTISISGTPSLYFGRIGTLSSQYFNGKIDQVRIFPTAITAGQVAELYQEKQCGATPITNASFHYDPTTLSDGAVTAWSDSGSINRSLDLVSASGTIIKNTSGGIESVDIPFVQTNSYLRVGGSSYTAYSDYPTNTSFTVSMFINVSTSYINFNKYVYLSDFSTASGVGLGQFTNFIWRYGLNPQEYDVTPIIQGIDFWVYSDVTPAMDFRPYGTWRMLTVTFEYNPSATSYLKWYYDDVLIHTESNTGTWGASATSFSLGAPSSLANRRDGGVKYGDVLGFYGEVKTQSEIAEMFAYLKGKYGL